MTALACSVILAAIAMVDWQPYLNQDSTRSAHVAPTTINIDAGTTYQTIEGFGSSERLFDDPHVTDTFSQATGRAAVTLTPEQQDEVLDKLYIDLGLTRVRPVSPDTGGGANVEVTNIEARNDNDDPDVADLSRFDFSWKRLDDHCAYVQRAQSRGVTTAFLAPLGREVWMQVRVGTSDAAEYAEWLLAQVDRCDDLGVSMAYLSIANEPSYTRNTMSGEFIRDVIKFLGPRLEEEGLLTKIVIPDDVRSSDAARKARVILGDPAARRYVAALATHLYDEPIVNMGQLQQLARQYQLPLWMTEFSMGALDAAGAERTPVGWAELMHDLLTQYDVSAIDYLWGFFGTSQGNGDQLVALKADASDVYTGYDLTKAYYMTGQYSRYIESGAQRVKADAPQGVKVSAFRNDASLVIVAINSGASSRTDEFRVMGYDGFDQVASTRTDGDGTNWLEQPAIDAREGTFVGRLPGMSVTTFVIGISAASPITSSPSVLRSGPESIFPSPHDRPEHETSVPSPQHQSAAPPSHGVGMGELSIHDNGHGHSQIVGGLDSLSWAAWVPGRRAGLVMKSRRAPRVPQPWPAR